VHKLNFCVSALVKRNYWLTVQFWKGFRSKGSWVYQSFTIYRIATAVIVVYAGKPILPLTIYSILVENAYQLNL